MISPRIAIWLGNLILLGFVSYFGAALGMDFLKHELERYTTVQVYQSPRVKQNLVASKIPLSAFQNILNANMFKAERSVKTPARIAIERPLTGQEAAAPAPAENLNLILTGTLIAGRKSFAMVADKTGRNEKVYRVGECMPATDTKPVTDCQPDQGKLVAVKKNLIRIDFQNRQVVLKISDNSIKISSKAARRPKRRVSRAPRRATPKTSPSLDTSIFPNTREGNSIDMHIPRDEVAKAFENFSDVLKQARVVPYSGKNGDGFQIRSIRPGSIFQKIGLHNFDVIQAVNGKPITTADQAVGMLTMFRNEKEVTLDIQRRNEALKLNYFIE